MLGIALKGGTLLTAPPDFYWAGVTVKQVPQKTKENECLWTWMGGSRGRL